MQSEFKANLKEIMRRKVVKGYYRLSTVQRAHLDLLIQAKKLEALEIQKEKSFQFLVKDHFSILLV